MSDLDEAAVELDREVLLTIVRPFICDEWVLGQASPADEEAVDAILTAGFTRRALPSREEIGVVLADAARSSVRVEDWADAVLALLTGGEGR